MIQQKREKGSAVSVSVYAGLSGNFFTRLSGDGGARLSGDAACFARRSSICLRTSKTSEPALKFRETWPKSFAAGPLRILKQALNTRRAYQNDLRHFMRFTGIVSPAGFRCVTLAHVIAWRKELEQLALSPASIRRKLSALSDLFDFLCDNNANTHNPVKGVKSQKRGKMLRPRCTNVAPNVAP